MAPSGRVQSDGGVWYGGDQGAAAQHANGTVLYARHATHRTLCTQKLHDHTYATVGLVRIGSDSLLWRHCGTGDAEATAAWAAAESST